MALPSPTITPAPKVVFSIPEAMAAIGIGRTRLYAEIGQGRLKAVKSGRRTLVPASAIEAWLQALPAAA